MAEPSPPGLAALKESIMRFAPAAAALSLLLAANASVSHADNTRPDPRAEVLLAQGRAALGAGETQAAIDAFEAALAIDPAYTPIFLELAQVARKEGLQGKAIRYYREALARDPGNLAAISGEGGALFEKGAVEKARGNLAQLESLCGTACPETLELRSAIARGVQPRVAASDAGATTN
ncbi:MAG: hypothetical protein APF82_04510 [Sphingomonadales bacterium BRH_c42]|nr:MAG: hypothetical protein APF82_04510 [Sphingomonadales bacterium BRH_c42]